MESDIDNSIKAAYLEFEKEPMDDWYNNTLMGYPSRLRVKKIIQNLSNNDKKVLEVGCEAGYVAMRIMKNGHEVVAFDICKPAIKKFQKKLINKKIDQSPFLAMAQNIPLKENTIDAVIATEVFEHMPKLNQVIKEIARVTKKGGKLIVTVPNESLRKVTYPIIKLFGINTDVEKEVTLFEYSEKDIIKRMIPYYKIQKVFSFPFFYPVTRMIIGVKR
jgi:ubiquinone/menaquinone biosynthesis C-methylase UbiE